MEDIKLSEQLKPRSKEVSVDQNNAGEVLEKLRSQFDKELNTPENKGEEISKASAEAKSQALASSETASKRSETSAGNPDQTIRTKLDREASYVATMQSVRQRLKTPERNFSKVIHSKLVESPSEIASKTIGRSSVLVGGFAVSFIGSLVLYVVARRNGYVFENNYSFMIVLFIIGALIGLGVELASKASGRRKT